MLFKLPRYSSQKNPFLADVLNRFADAIETSMNREYRSGPNMLVRSDDGQVHFEAVDQSNPVTTNSFPYEGTDASDTTAAKVTVFFGTHNNVPPQIGGVDLVPPVGTPVPKLSLGTTPGLAYVYVEFDFTFDTAQKITGYTGKSIHYATDAVPSSTLTFATDGSGTGSLYQLLFLAIVAAPSGAGGSYSATIYPNLNASQQFSICGASIVVTPVGA